MVAKIVKLLIFGNLSLKIHQIAKNELRMVNNFLLYRNP